MRFNMRPNNENTATARTGYQSTIATHQVLRNTYLLLSLTLLFSAVMAGVSLSMGAPSLNIFVQIIGMFGLLFLTMALRNSAWGILCVFAFTGFTGFTLGPMLNMYLTTFTNGSQLVLSAAGATGVIFLALSGYVLTTKKDFSFMGGFLFIALLGAIVLSLAGMIFHMPMMHLAVSGLFVLIFSGYILFDTSRILHNGETNYVMATISLYINILNLFISLLQILSAFAGNRD